jgi:ubiquinone/menaquinone biosynthesis C-methylase UbiE
MSRPDLASDSVEAHYVRQDLESAILTALDAAGLEVEHLGAGELAGIDEFHVGGRRATLALAQKLGLDETMQVLDVGSGLGGASRCLATEFGCHVTGLDLCRDYCRLAALFARRLGLDARVAYRHGNALEMPFADASFDVLWTQHAAMNIADKARLYREMLRVLKPGGVLGLYDILSGEGGPVHFPVPWAREPSISFLQTPRQLRQSLEAGGFEILHWRDSTETGRLWFRRRNEKAAGQGSAPLGLQLLLGPEFPAMAQNQLRNLEEDRIALIEAIVRRPFNREA